MLKALSPEVLAYLRTYSTPTVANAIETFNVRPRTAGFMSGAIRCVFPELGPMVGYAVTAKCRAAAPPPPGAAALRIDSWRAIEAIPAPRIVVLQDLDDPPGVGAYWGEVQSAIHRAMGCLGTITNGGVRDLEEVRALGFHFFAGSVVVSHAYVHLVEVGTPTEVGGLMVAPGDLLHADRHGVLSIPAEIADRIPEGVAQVERTERELIAYAKDAGFTRAGLEELWRRLRS